MGTKSAFQGRLAGKKVMNQGPYSPREKELDALLGQAQGATAAAGADSSSEYLALPVPTSNGPLHNAVGWRTI